MYIRTVYTFLYVGVGIKCQNSFASFELQLDTQPKRCFSRSIFTTKTDILSSACKLHLSKC